jgi:hypothetical protein
LPWSTWAMMAIFLNFFIFKPLPAFLLCGNQSSGFRNLIFKSGGAFPH